MISHPRAGAVVFACLLAGAGGGPGLAYGPLGPGAITASVRDDTGRPVANARVSAVGPSSRDAVTTRAGIVSLLALPLGTYRVLVVCRGFETLDASVTLGPQHALDVVNLRLVRASLGTAPSALDGSAKRVAQSGIDPNLSHALLELPEGSLLGTAPYESRATLDGIPLAGPASGPAAIRPSVLQLDRIDALAGPGIAAPSLDGVIGGDLDYRTPALGGASNAALLAGYDSQFGAYQQVRGIESAGRLGLSADVVAGGGARRAQAFAGRYALSEATALSASYYNSQDSVSDGGRGQVHAFAPAFLATLDTRFLGGSFAARTYQSELNATDVSDGIAATPARDLIRGLSAGFEEPLGQDALGVTFDQRADTVGNSFGDLVRALGSIALRGDFHLGSGGSLQLAGTRSQGTDLTPRNDVQAGLALPLANGWTLRAAAGSAFVTTPFELLSTLPPPELEKFAPETSFGMRFGFDDRLPGGTLELGVFQLTRWDRFAPLADARSHGLTLGYARNAALRGFGFDAGLTLERDVAFGAPQPFARIVPTYEPYLGALPNVSDSSAHVGLVYRLDAGEIRWTTVYLGPDNELTNRPMTFSQATLRLRVWKSLSLQASAATPVQGAPLPRTYGLSLLEAAR